MTPQDVSTMLRLGQNNIIFLINNGGYTIEVEIHDGPYNVIKNWDYTAIVNAMDNHEGNCWATKVQSKCSFYFSIFIYTYSTMNELQLVVIIIYSIVISIVYNIRSFNVFSLTNFNLLSLFKASTLTP